MIRASSMIALAAMLLTAPALAQPHSGFPINVVVPKAPAPVEADGRARLVYELALTSFAPSPVELAAIDVLAGDAVVASWRGAELGALLMPVGPAPEAGKERLIESGRSVIAFIDLTLAPGAAAPDALRHRLTFTAKLGDGTVIERKVEGVAISVRPAAPVIGPPLRGGRWVAANGLFAADHRRSFNAVDAREHLAQRFAIDWVKLGPDGRFFKGDAGQNTSYPGYGTEVIAVADGTVADVTSGYPDNPGSNPPSSRVVTLESITGNAVVQDLGGGTFALYAHLQPGSIAVKPGDHVKAGQVIARLGNSGNSDAPHLHFQLMDGPSPLGAEGLPHAITAFSQQGVVADLAALESGQPVTITPAANAQHAAEFPVDQAVVSFP
ncbi:M23 family metallopeptidase [Novosphingobium sediminis]|nr:M23 family metallopeptidase [Novosphingobium sediminis]